MFPDPVNPIIGCEGKYVISSVEDTTVDSSHQHPAVQALGAPLVAALVRETPMACQTLSLKQLLSQLFVEHLCVLSDGKPIDVSSELQSWLQLWDDLRNPDKPLDKYTRLILGVWEKFATACNHTYNNIFYHTMQLLETSSVEKRRSMGPCFHEAWDLPIYQLDGQYQGTTLDRRSDIDLRNDELLQSKVLIPNYQNFMLLSLPSISDLSNALFKLQDLMNKFSPLEMGVGTKAIRENALSAHLRQHMSSDYLDIRNILFEYNAFICRLKDLRGYISAEHIEQLYKGSGDLQEETLAYVRHDLMELVQCVMRSRRQMISYQMTVNKRLDDLKTLVAYASTGSYLKLQTTKNLKEELNTFRSLSPADQSNAGFMSCRSKGLLHDYLSFHKEANAVQDIIKRERANLEFFSIVVEPLIKVMEERIRRLEFAEARLKAQALATIQRCDLEDSAQHLDFEDAEPLSIRRPKKKKGFVTRKKPKIEPESSPTLGGAEKAPSDPDSREIGLKVGSNATIQAKVAPVEESALKSVRDTFQQLRPANDFALQAAGRVTDVIALIEQEIADNRSIANDVQLGEHLSYLLVQLSVAVEQTVTTLRLLKRDPKTRDEALSLSSHWQLEQLQDLALPEPIVTSLKAVIAEVERGEILERDVYETVRQRRTRCRLEELLRACEELRLHQFTGDKRALAQSVYHMVQTHLCTLANVVRESSGGVSIRQVSLLTLPIIDHQAVRQPPEMLHSYIERLDRLSGIIDGHLKGQQGFQTWSEWEARLANARRYLAFVRARLMRSENSDNLKGFYLALNRYLYHAAHQVAMAVADKTGKRPLENVSKVERAHSLWEWVYTCGISDSFSESEREFLFRSHDVNDLVRYMGRPVKGFSDNGTLLRAIRSISCLGTRPNFLMDHISSVKSSEEGWHEIPSSSDQARMISVKVCQDVFTTLDAAVEIIDRFLRLLDHHVS